MSASCFLVSMHSIWILGSKIDSIKQSIKNNSVGSGNMSHCRTSLLYDHCFVVFKDVQQNFLTRRFRVRGNKNNILQIIKLSRNFLRVGDVDKFRSTCLPLIRISVKNSNDPDPTSQIHPETCIQGNDF